MERISGPGVLQEEGGEVLAQQTAIQAADGVTVYGDFFPPPASRAAPSCCSISPAPIGRIRTITADLVKAGYNVLVIDQRAGGPPGAAST